ncbi:hypothetical protein [Sphingomonas sp.]|uniref:hypothetical protein n=1 Tax=Sphingomonas sp. TaxID=28214 RepID=UPI003B00CB13
MSLPLVLVLVGMVWFFVADGDRVMIGWFVFAAGFALQVFLGLTIACPKCGKSPYTIGPNWGPFGFAGKPIPDVICSRCSHDFRTKSNGS